MTLVYGAVSPRAGVHRGQALATVIYIRNLYFIIVKDRQASAID